MSVNVCLPNIDEKDTNGIKNPAGTRLPGDVPQSSPKRGPSGDSQETNTKIDDLMKKLFFKSNSPCITYIFLFFTGRKNLQKF